MKDCDWAYLHEGCAAETPIVELPTEPTFDDFSFYYFTRNRFYFASKIQENSLIKWLSFTYILLVSFLRSVKHKKTRIYFNILKEFYAGTEFKRQNQF